MKRTAEGKRIKQVTGGTVSMQAVYWGGGGLSELML